MSGRTGCAPFGASPCHTINHSISWRVVALGVVFVLLGVLTFLPTRTAYSLTVLVDPSNPGSTGSDAASGRTVYSTLDSALKAEARPVHIKLAPGRHGRLQIVKDSDVHVEGSAEGASILDGIEIRASENIRVSNLSVTPPEYGTAGNGNQKDGTSKKRRALPYLVRVLASRSVQLDGNRIYSTTDGREWTRSDWQQKVYSAIFLRGDDHVVRDNEMTFVGHGIIAVGDNGLIERNRISHFAGDGIRGLGNYNVYQDNIVHTCYDIDGNHDDGFQSYSQGPNGRPGHGISRGSILRRNKFIQALEDAGELACRLQGIGMFAGLFVDWVIENNLVVVDQVHGITLLGAENVVIRNNTLIDPNPGSKFFPMIRILPNRMDKSQPVGNLIINNLGPASRFEKANRKGRFSYKPVEGVREYANLFYKSQGIAFRDPRNGDYRPSELSPGIDRAVSDSVAKDDIDGLPRPYGDAPDVGAYEYRPGD